jgi:hypothetical protein
MCGSFLAFMKKIVLLILIVLLVCGCGANSTPTLEDFIISKDIDGYSLIDSENSLDSELTTPDKTVKPHVNAKYGKNQDEIIINIVEDDEQPRIYDESTSLYTHVASDSFGLAKISTIDFEGYEIFVYESIAPEDFSGEYKLCTLISVCHNFVFTVKGENTKDDALLFMKELLSRC